MPLSVDSYQQAETRGRASSCNRVIEAFLPEVFNSVGYPTRVGEEAELWRYVDTMHETRFAATVEGLLGGLSGDEFELFQRATELVCGLTQRLFGRKLPSYNALLRAMAIFRHIRCLQPSRVLEFGPGSGYLGLLLILDGLNYTGVENTQAFYLWQNRLWEEAASGSFADQAESNSLARVTHIPWWRVVDLDLELQTPSFDLVTANHCLCEMHLRAMKYYLRWANRQLRESPLGVFLFEGWGWDGLRLPTVVAEEFHRCGFAMCHNQKGFTAYELSGRNPDLCARIPRPVPLYRRLRNLARRAVMLDPVAYEYLPPAHSHPQHPVSRALSAVASVPRQVGVREIWAYLESLHGADLIGPEERFLSLIQASL